MILPEGLQAITPVLGWTLAHFLWQGALLAALLELALKTTRRAETRHNLAFGVLLAMAAAPVVTFAWLRADVSVIRVSVADFPGPGRPSWETAAVLAWTLGVALLALRSAGGAWWVDRLRRAAEVLPPAWIARCNALSRRLPGALPVTFGQTTALSVPAVAGWFRPMILIPAAALAHMPADQLEALILHELAHVRRFDAFANLIQVSVEILLFYHPAVWWVSRRIRLEREHACDEMAAREMGDPALVARALQAIEGLRQVPAPALSAGGGQLKVRVLRLLQIDASPRRPALSWAAALGVLALTAGVFLRGPELEAQAQEPVLPSAARTPAPAAAPVPMVRTVAAVTQPAPAALPTGFVVYFKPKAARPAGQETSSRPDLLGPMPPGSDPAGQAAWRLKSYDQRIESTRSILNTTRQGADNAAAAVTASSGARPDDPARRLSLTRLDLWRGQSVMYDLQVEALQKARDLTVEAEQIRLDMLAGLRAPQDLDQARARQAAAEARIVELARLTNDQHVQVNQRLQEVADEVNAQVRAADVIVSQNLSRNAQVATERAMASPKDPILSRAAVRETARMQDWLESQQYNAEIDAARQVARVALDRSREASIVARQEEQAYIAVRDAVRAGARAPADLTAATETLRQAQQAQYDALDAVQAAQDEQARLARRRAQADRVGRAQENVAMLETRIADLEARLAGLLSSGVAPDSPEARFWAEQLIESVQERSVTPPSPPTPPQAAAPIQRAARPALPILPEG